MADHGFHRNNNTIQNGAEVQVYSEPIVQEQKGKPLLAVTSIGCQTDRSDEKDIYTCPKCSLPCWLCNTVELADKPLPEVINKSGIEEMPNQAPSSSATSGTKTSSTKRLRNYGLVFLRTKRQELRKFYFTT